MEFVDAPVSGGVGGAEAGTLTFMVGGSDENFARAKPFLECMGQNIVHCGAVGTGEGAKICNNMLLAISMIGVAETMHLGKASPINVCYCLLQMFVTASCIILVILSQMFVPYLLPRE